MYMYDSSNSGDQSGLNCGPKRIPSTVDFVIVGIEKIGVRMLRDVQGHFGQRVRSQFIVVVEEGEEIALGQGRRRVGGPGNAEIHRVAD